MKRLISLVVLVLAILSALPEIAEAQYRTAPGRGGYYGGGYGPYDGYAARRAYPGRYGYGYYDPYLERTMNEECYQARETYRGMTGTFHGHKGELHFRPCDHTNNPIRTREGGVWGAVLGGVSGAGVGAVFGGKKGAKIGAAIGGVTGTVIGMTEGKGKEHEDCILVEGGSTDSAEGGHKQAPVDPKDSSKSSAVTKQGPAFRPGKWSVENSTDVRLEIYDGEQKGEDRVGILDPKESWNLDLPRFRYRAFALVPNYEGGISVLELQLNPGNTGWTFAEPVIRPVSQ